MGIQMVDIKATISNPILEWKGNRYEQAKPAYLPPGSRILADEDAIQKMAAAGHFASGRAYFIDGGLSGQEASADTTLGYSDVGAWAVSGNATMTLPAAGPAYEGFQYQFSNADGSTITVRADGQNIDDDSVPQAALTSDTAGQIIAVKVLNGRWQTFTPNAPTEYPAVPSVIRIGDG